MLKSFDYYDRFPSGRTFGEYTLICYKHIESYTQLNI